MRKRHTPAAVPRSELGCTRFPTGSQPFPGSYSGIPTVSLKTSSLFPAAMPSFLKGTWPFPWMARRLTEGVDRDVTGDENYGLNFYGESSDTPLPLPTYTSS